MIRQEDVFLLGQILKPHGIKGELSFSFTTEVFDEKETPFFILETEGILVPFFIESYRLKNNDTGLVKFEGINSEEQARELSHSRLFLPKSYYEAQEEEMNIHYYTGFSVIDSRVGNVGKITDVDDSTENPLFIIDHNGKELLIPAVDNFIDKIDDEKRIIFMHLPVGLVNLEEAEDE